MDLVVKLQQAMSPLTSLYVFANVSLIKSVFTLTATQTLPTLKTVILGYIFKFAGSNKSEPSSETVGASTMALANQQAEHRGTAGL